MTETHEEPSSWPSDMTSPCTSCPSTTARSFQTKMFGWKGTLTAAQTAEIAAAKQVIYDGFQAAVAGGVREGARRHPGGRAVRRRHPPRRRRGTATSTACPVEKSGQDEFDFEYGEDFARHIEAVNPTFCKVLVRYNPEGDAALNQRQAARLKRLSDYLHGSDRLFMFELLVPAEPGQLKRFQGDKKAYDLELRPGADGADHPRAPGRGRRAGRLEDRGARPPRGLREGRRGRAAGRPRQGGLHHPGPGRGRQEGPRVADDGGRRRRGSSASPWAARPSGTRWSTGGRTGPRARRPSRRSPDATGSGWTFLRRLAVAQRPMLDEPKGACFRSPAPEDEIGKIIDDAQPDRPADSDDQHRLFQPEGGPCTRRAGKRRGFSRARSSGSAFPGADSASPTPAARP